MKAERQVAPKGASTLPPLPLRTGPQLTWAADLMLALGTDRLPLAEAASSTAAGRAHSKVPSGTVRSSLAQFSSTQAWDGRWESQPAQQEAAMGEGGGARGPASPPSTGLVPRGESPEKTPGLSWAG